MHSAIIEESALIQASPEAVYNVLADYHVGHRAILPKPYFVDMRVIAGGFGAGTIVEVDMEVYGVKRSMLVEVSEAQTGRLLREVDEKAGIDTQFIFEAVDGACRLTIYTKMTFSAGFRGFLEKLSTPAITRRIYQEELQNIAAYLQANPQMA